MNNSKQRGFETMRAHARILFNSSLKSEYFKKFITTTKLEFYNIKIIRCGNYIQVYKFSDIKSKTNKNLSILDGLNVKHVDTDNLFRNKREINSSKTILVSNAKRSHLSCQRLCKANSDSWKTFITLTIADNITDLKDANSRFHNWTSNIRKLKKDFKYIAVPEFQKRGAVHYHVLSNLDLEDKKIIYEQKIKKGNAKKCDHIFDVKYWPHGYVRVDFIKNDDKKIYSYICKYMTKDIDTKLFGKKRYFFSQNLDKPEEEFLNLSNDKDYNYFLNLLQDKKIQYKNSYKDKYLCNIDFEEYL